MSERPEFLTPAEVSARFRVSKSTVYRWVREDIVKAVRIGNTVRVRSADIEAKLTEAA